MKGLYIHIPFCPYLCHYCDFCKMVAKNEEVINKYLDKLIDEIESYQDHFDRIQTIYIGGGTPSILSIEQTKRLLGVLTNIKPIEFTIEINPDVYTKELGETYFEYGINRISLGVQTGNDNLLKYLNRKHSKEMVISTFNSLRSIGFDNISIDLIFGIPGQTMQNIRDDLKMVKMLKPDHISYYSLILEDKTYFYHQFLRNKFHPVSEDECGKQFELIIDQLTKMGYEHYEISNFAKPGKCSRHNMIYWTMGEYIGCGLGASGFINNIRTLNHRSLIKYQKEPIKELIPQTIDDNISDELIFGLRLLDGISILKLNQKYQIDLLSKFSQIEKFISDGLLEMHGDYLRLTKLGLMLGNQVFMEFL